MTKLAALLLLISTSAFAAPASYQLGFTVSNGKDSRHYDLSLVDKTCGHADLHARDVSDEIKVCTTTVAKNVLLEIEWKTRENDREVIMTPHVLATAGTPVTVEGGGEKLTISIQ